MFQQLLTELLALGIRGAHDTRTGFVYSLHYNWVLYRDYINSFYLGYWLNVYEWCTILVQGLCTPHNSQQNLERKFFYKAQFIIPKIVKKVIIFCTWFLHGTFYYSFPTAPGLKHHYCGMYILVSDVKHHFI